MPGKPRRKHFKVDELPDEIRSAVHDLIQGGRTYRDIAEHLVKMGHPIAPSSLCRYGKDFMARLERIRTVNDQAKAIIEESDGNPLRLEEAATQISLGLMTEALLKMQDLEGADPVQLMRALAHLQSASVQRERLRIQWREEQKTKASEAADRVEKNLSGKVSPETLKYIRTELLGLAT